MTVEFDGKSFDVDTVIKNLRPIVSPERLDRIHSVIGKRRNDLCLVMENIYNRGNTSAVMRSLEAFGYHNIHHIELQQDFKESTRVTQGADKWLLQKKWTSTESCVSQLKASGHKVYVTHLEGGRPISECDFSAPVALCFGNEQDGASEALTELADERVFVPMYGFVQSFNISVAAALCLQHIRSVHDRQGHAPLPEDEARSMEALYLLRSCRNPYQILKSKLKADA